MPLLKGVTKVAMPPAVPLASDYFGLLTCQRACAIDLCQRYFSQNALLGFNAGRNPKTEMQSGPRQRCVGYSVDCRDRAATTDTGGPSTLA